MKRVDELLSEARANRSWGNITIRLKAGEPTVIEKTITEKVEDKPYNEKRQ